MLKGIRYSLIALLISCASLNGFAQLSKKAASVGDGGQDSLLKLSREIFSAPNNQIRFAKNAAFVKNLVSVLKNTNSFNYRFDSLQSISHVVSPDQSFKIFSWFVPTDDGAYRFFGSIQMRTADGSLKLFPLIDDTENFKDPNAITDNRKWFGSRYYEIVPITNPGKQTCYALLGWKGNSSKTSKKVVEILSFANGQPVFGKEIIEGQKNTAAKNRIVFEYNKLNSMTLRWDKAAGMIVLDHLAPFNPDMVGNYEYYASDLSFDGYKPVGGKLKLIENIDLKNDPSRQDDFYIDPKRKDIPPKKKF
ncbi:MAG: hypothetical protein JWQ28_2399 [Pedobacter sp.]|nr:hypothetical protein [Pedobacter sp.]